MSERLAGYTGPHAEPDAETLPGPVSVCPAWQCVPLTTQHRLEDEMSPGVGGNQAAESEEEETLPATAAEVALNCCKHQK